MFIPKIFSLKRKLARSFKDKENSMSDKFSPCLRPFYTPTKRSDAQLLVEREKQFECLPVEISRS